MPEIIDYEALAKQHGGTFVPAAPQAPSNPSAASNAIDYQALAKQHGGTFVPTPAATGEYKDPHGVGIATARQPGFWESVIAPIREGALGRALHLSTETAEVRREDPSNPIIRFEAALPSQRRGILSGVAKTASSLTTPENISIMAATSGLGAIDAAIGKTALSKLASLGFSSMMIHNAATRVPGFVEAVKKGDWDTAKELAAQGVTETLLAAHGVKNATTEATPVGPKAVITSPERYSALDNGQTGYAVPKGQFTSPIAATPPPTSVGAMTPDQKTLPTPEKVVETAIAKAKQPVTSLFKVDPKVAVVKAFGTGIDPRVVDNAPETIADIVTHGGKFESNEQLLSSAKAAKDKLQPAFDAYVDRAEKQGVQFPLDEMVQATQDAIPYVDKRSAEGTAAYEHAQKLLEDARATYSGETVPSRKMNQIRQDLNDKVNKFYGLSLADQNAAIGAGFPIAILKAQRDTAARIQYPRLDPATEGAAPAEINRRIGNITGLEGAAEERRNAIQAEKPLSKAGVAGKLVSAAIALPGKKLLPGLAVADAAKGSVLNPKIGPTDALIKRLGNAAGEAAPIPALPPEPINPGAGTPTPPRPDYYEPPTGPAPFKSAAESARVLASTPNIPASTAAESAEAFASRPGFTVQPPIKSAAESAQVFTRTPNVPASTAEEAATAIASQPGFTQQPPMKSAAESAAVLQNAPESPLKAARKSAEVFFGGPEKPTVPETGIPEEVARGQARRDQTLKDLGISTPWEELSNSERLAVDAWIAQGEAGSAQPITPPPPRQVGMPLPEKPTGTPPPSSVSGGILGKTPGPALKPKPAPGLAQNAQKSAKVKVPEALKDVRVEQPTKEPVTGAATGATESGRAGEGQAVLESRQPSNQVRTGKATVVKVPNEPGNNYDAEYEVRELADIQPSHEGHTFQANPKYQIQNERNYTDKVNQELVIQNSGPTFDPDLLITDNATATNGPPIIDVNGNTLGGNSRVMTLQRVYKNNPEAATRYKKTLADNAYKYGIDPAEIADMKEPVLVRKLAKGDIDSRKAVTDFNKRETKDLTATEQATSDARALTPALVEHISTILDNAGESSLTEVMNSDSGPALVNKLIDEGVFNAAEKGKLIDQQSGAVTQLAKDRISKMLLGDFFKDSDQMQRTPPEIKNKLERIASTTMGLQAVPGWDIKPTVREALSVLEYAKSQGIKYFPDINRQTGFFNEAPKFSDESITVAQALRDMGPLRLARAFREFASNSRPGLFREVGRKQAIEDAFGK